MVVVLYNCWRCTFRISGEMCQTSLAIYYRKIARNWLERRRNKNAVERKNGKKYLHQRFNENGNCLLTFRLDVYLSLYSLYLMWWQNRFCVYVRVPVFASHEIVYMSWIRLGFALPYPIRQLFCCSFRWWSFCLERHEKKSVKFLYLSIYEKRAPAKTTFSVEGFHFHMLVVCTLRLEMFFLLLTEIPCTKCF